MADGMSTEEEEYRAALPGRQAEVATLVTAWGQAHGILPDGVELVPMDLEADAQWMAPAPQNLMARAPEPPDVLARIDSVIEDWELGPDAAQWSPDVPEPQFVGILATLDGEYAGSADGPRMWIGDQESPITGLQVEEEWTWPTPGMIRFAAEYERQTRALVQSAGEHLITSLRSVCESVLLLARMWDPKICHHNPTCFCRPAPFPAARDYHRRTRHRNRRRKP